MVLMMVKENNMAFIKKKQKVNSKELYDELISLKPQTPFQSYIINKLNKNPELFESPTILKVWIQMLEEGY
jgi:hypothetical protein